MVSSDLCYFMQSGQEQGDLGDHEEMTHVDV